MNAKDSPVGVSTSPKATSPTGSGTPEDDVNVDGKPGGGEVVPTLQQATTNSNSKDSKLMASTSVEKLVAELDEGMPMHLAKPLHEQEGLADALMVEDSLVSDEDRKMVNLMTGNNAGDEGAELDPIDDLS